jgi:hypothetical protein
MKLSLTILLLLAVFAAAHAQTIIKPGDQIVRQDLIKPSHNFYKAFWTDTLGNIKDEWINDEVISIDSATGGVTFARSRQVPVGSFSTDTSFTDRFFRPIRMHEVHVQRNVSFIMTFDETMASVETFRKGVASTKTYPMKSGYFEDNMIEYIFGYLDLQKGIVYTLDDFNKDAPSPSDPFTIEYAFDDIWALDAGGVLKCRVIHFIHGGTTGYFWIDKDTRRMIKEEGNNKNGVFSITRI